MVMVMVEFLDASELRHHNFALISIEDWEEFFNME
jgi:hypothetical protein